MEKQALNNLQGIMKIHNISVEEIAGTLELSTSAVYKRLSGQVEVTLKEAYKIYQLFPNDKVKFEELFPGEEI